jgi:hypothetical protein
MVGLVDNEIRLVQRVNQQHPRRLLTAAVAVALGLSGCFLNSGPVAHADLVLRVVNQSTQSATVHWAPPTSGGASEMIVQGCRESAQGLDAGTYSVDVTSSASHVQTSVVATPTGESEVTKTIAIHADGSIDVAPSPPISPCGLASPP